VGVIVEVINAVVDRVVDEIVVEVVVVLATIVLLLLLLLLLTDVEETTADDTDAGAAPQVGVVPFVQGMVSMYTGEH